jgi:hypothetical protein
MLPEDATLAQVAEVLAGLREQGPQAVEGFAGRVVGADEMLDTAAELC